jgi:hypothetical protein
LKEPSENEPGVRNIHQSGPIPNVRKKHETSRRHKNRIEGIRHEKSEVVKEKRVIRALGVGSLAETYSFNDS